MKRLQAIIRKPARTLDQCELTFLQRRPIDIDRARRQHADYAEALRDLGIDVITLPTRDEWPDSVFVEDAAIVLDEIAVITRPGVASRQQEGAGLLDALQPFRPIHVMREPSTLDGGDVVRLDRSLYVGLSSRSNTEGIEELRSVVNPFGYTVTPVALDGCLHLKSACVALGPDVLLADPTRVNTAPFHVDRILTVPSDERDVADALAIGDTVLIAAGYPATRGLLQDAGYNVRELDLSEFAKAEAGPTCLSLIFETDSATSAPRPRHRSRT
ncbi:MAG: dimethylarginine dimethylaminohydrolase family protein [Longimicrobiales bacterium]